MTLDFRPYQLDDMAALEKAWQGGMTRRASSGRLDWGRPTESPSQAVKTVHEGGRAIVVAHRDILLDQSPSESASTTPGSRSGACRLTRISAAAGSWWPRRRPSRTPAAWSGSAASTRSSLTNSITIGAPTFRGILEGLGSFDGVPTLGVTATMRRDDKKHGLAEVCQGIVAERDIVWAVDHGWLVPPRGKVVVADHMDLEHAKINRGDFSDSELGAMVTQDADQIARAWREHGENRITAAFCPTVDSASALAEALRALGVPAASVFGKTPTAERQDVYGALGAGQLRVMTSVMVPTEGFDRRPSPASCSAGPPDRAPCSRRSWAGACGSTPARRTAWCSTSWAARAARSCSA